MRRTVLFSVIFTLLLSVSLRAQVTLTVADGNATNGYIPVYGYYTDDFLHEQVVYPASMLSAMAGGEISAMKFYFYSSPSNEWDATFIVKLGITEEAAFPTSASSFLTGAITTTHTGTLTLSNDNTMTITFNAPFLYTGGNLLLDITTAETGDYSSGTFIGINSARGSAYAYNSSGVAYANSPTVQNFIPKTSFTYMFGDTCMHPCNLEVADLTGSSALIRWKNAATFIPNHYEVSYKLAEAASWTTVPDAITTEYYTLTELQPNANYMVRIRAFCDATTPTAYSDTLTFNAECPAPTLLTVSNIDPHSATLNWTAPSSSFELSVNNATQQINSQGTGQHSFTLDNLSPETAYYVKLRTDCGGGEYSTWTTTVNFTTPEACPEPWAIYDSAVGAYSLTLGWLGYGNNNSIRYRKTGATFYEDFENEIVFEDEGPLHWTTYDLDDDGYDWDWTFYWGYASDFDEEGTEYGCVRSENSTFWHTNPDNWIISPLIDLQGFLKVWLRGDEESTYEEHFAVYLSTTGTNVPSDFTTVLIGETVAPKTDGSKEEFAAYVADLSAYAGQQGYIAIRHFNCSYRSALELDRFGIYVIDTTNNPWQTVTSSSNTVTLSGLDPESQYEVQVFADCGQDGMSGWSESYYVTTAEACPIHVNILEPTDVAGSSAMIEWQNPSTLTPDHYELSYKRVDQTAWTTVPDAITTEYFMLTGLQPETDYMVRVRAFCDATTTSRYSEAVTFSTECSGGQQEGTIAGNTTSTSNSRYVPFNTSYKYNYCQMLYPTDEVGEEKDITALSLQYIYSGYLYRDLDIYLGHTTQSAFSSTTNWVSADDLTLVYSGGVGFYNYGENYWLTIPLDTIFHYNGTDNLVVVFDDNTGATVGYQYRFYMHSTTGYRSMVARTSSDISPASPGTGTRYNDVPNMIFTPGCLTDGCDRANVAAEEITDASARIVFTPGTGNTACELEYKRSIDSAYTALPANGTSYQLTGLRPNTEYQVRVRAICSAGNSLWKETTFTTGVLDFPRLYVTANGTGNGGSWATAYGDLNEALDAAEAIRDIHGTYPEIWMAEGTWYGDSVSTNAFTIREGISIYGGFAGNETDLSQRDVAAHPTILDGQHSQRVLWQTNNFSTTTVIDGLTIQNGHANNGGGLYLRDMTNIRHCVIRNNTATEDGGGICMYNSHFSNYGLIEDCIVTHNTATDDGGGIWARYGLIHHCVVSHNAATSTSSYGGGICTEFVNNSYSTISNCLVANNTAGYGGGIYNYNSCFVDNTTIVRNIATTNGGGTYGNPYMRNCIVWGNRQGNVSNNVGSNATCTYTAVEGGYHGEGNITLMAEDFNNGQYYPYFANPSVMAGHLDSTENVDWHLLNGSVCVNRGHNEFVTFSDSLDLSNTPRIKQGTVDMGCYESDYQETTLPEYGNIIYVKVNGSGNHTGTSWSNALGSIADAFGLAQMYPADIWVAEGVYYGDSVSTNAFEMVDGVSLYGGFAGNETELSQRDPAAHVTILDGQHSQRVLNQPNSFTNPTVIDGFTIRNGYTTGSGGGVSLQSGTTLSHCIISHCQAESAGGVSCYGSNGDTVIISHCTISHNRASKYGGGLNCNYAKVSDCLIEYDTASSYQQGFGGGLYASYANVVRCTVRHNFCNMQGGGIHVGYTSVISQCEITHNVCNNNGGGVYLSNSNANQATLDNCLIANNTAAYGAGLYNNYINVVRNLTVVNNNISSSNTNNTGAGVYSYSYYSSDNYTLTIQNSVFWGNRVNGVVNNLMKNNAGTSFIVSHCAFEGGYESGDNIVTLLPDDAANGLMSPHFVNPALTAGYLDNTPNPDWHLANGSPCANKGDNSVADTADLDGNARIQQGVVDLGCYESPYSEVALPTYPDGIIYVTEQGTGTGESWANAINSIPAAIDLATTHHAVVWVATGTYYGDTASSNAFMMREGISVYGGFAGNEPANYDLALRDFTTNVSILDGQNARRVLYQPANFTATTAVTWDGFTIQNGRSTENGAGVYMRAYTTLSNCIIQHNTVAPVNSSTATVTRQGGGIYAYGSQVTVSGVKQRTSRISHCRIAYNAIEHTQYLQAYGGGVYAYQTDFDHTEICHNSSDTYGGGLYLNNEAKVSNCLIHNNASYRGGGLCSNGSTTFLNCDIVNNTVTNNGGGYYRDGGTATFTNCIIWGNKKESAVNNIYGSQGNYTYCAVEEGRTGTGNITLAPANDGVDASQNYVRFNNPENEDFQLHPTSICVNVGNSDVVTDSLDFYGYQRIHGDAVDIGCSEAQDESACPSVVGLTVNNITTSNAHLTWHPTGSETSWVVVYGEQGGATSTMTVNDTTCVLTGLSLNRNYMAKVRAVCGDGMMSVFSITVNFQTICDPSLLDTLSNFSLMTPADSTIIYQNNVAFSWTALPEATSYDFYLWAADGTEPATPTLPGLTVAGANNVTLPGYERDKYYHWKVVAWNECISKTSPVMTLRVDPSYHTSVTAEICNGGSYDFYGQTLTTAGSYTHTLQSVLGYDSVITLTLKVNPVYHTPVTAEICDGNSYNFYGQTLTTAGSYTHTLQSVKGCDSVINLTLIVNPVYNTPVTAEICDGDSYDFFGQTLTAAGTYNHTLQTVKGCDSVITLTLTVNPVYNTPVTAEICDGDSYSFFDTTLTTAGTYTHTLQTVKGCDSVITLTLTVNPVYNTPLTATICDGGSYSFFDTTLTTAGIYIHTLQTAKGCDSVITLTLTVNPTYNNVYDLDICEGERLLFDGDTITESGTYIQTIQTVNGCDSVTTIVLTVHPKDTTLVTAEICDGSSYNFFGQTLTTAGTYSHTLQTVIGCGSVIVLTLTVNPLYNTPTTATICDGGSYDFFGQTLSTAGTYNHTLQSVNGCDSVITLTLTVNPVYNTPTTATICEGGSYDFFGQTLTTAGTYTHTLQTVNGCDSVITLTLTVNPVYNTPVSAAICDGDSYNFFGQILTTEGTYTHTLQSVSGCDSVIALALTVNPLYNTPVTAQICEGGSYDFFGQTLTTAGDYTHTLQSASGCDSTISLSLIVLNTDSTQFADESCGSYTWNNVTYNESGDYTQTLTNAAGCDSIVTLHLMVLSPVAELVEATVCESHTWNGVTYTVSGDYDQTFTAANGCDSVVTLHLTVLYGTHNVEADTACESFMWHGETYTTSGVYTYEYTNNDGCASADTLHLTITPADFAELAETSCESYEWNGQTYTTSGDYVQTFTNAAGCDSTVTLHLIVNHGTHNVETETACESFTWHGETYTTSGTYTYAYTNANGCASADTLHLTVNHGTHNVETETACESFTWHGTPYTTSGTYTYAYTNADGCASADTLHLTVNHGTHNVETETACESYTWHGETYTTSGTYTYAYNNANGCASVDTLHLTVNYGTHNVETESACESYTWHGETYTTSGTYTYAYTNANGCASADTLHLTVHYGTHNVETEAACESFTWHGETYTTSGVYTYAYNNGDGCESVDTLYLTVNYSATSDFSITTEDSCYEWNNVNYCETGDYTQTLQTVDGCDSVVTLHLTITVGIDDHDLSAFMTVYPNPTAGIVNVQCTMNNVQVETLEYHVFDAFGRLLQITDGVETGEHGSFVQTAQIDLSGFANGIYLVKAVADGNVVAVRKVVKR